MSRRQEDGRNTNQSTNQPKANQNQPKPKKTENTRTNENENENEDENEDENDNAKANAIANANANAPPPFPLSCFFWAVDQPLELGVPKQHIRVNSLAQQLDGPQPKLRVSHPSIHPSVGSFVRFQSFLHTYLFALLELRRLVTDEVKPPSR